VSDAPPKKPGKLPRAAEAAIAEVAADAELTPEVKEAFAQVVRRLERRRKINIAAYLLALVVMLGGMFGGLAFMAAGHGKFRGWILIVPIALVGLIFWGFGRWAKRA
jgi:hypothetical protein